MRLWDRITGGAAQIVIETEKPCYVAGDLLRVRAQVSSEGDLEAKSALVTLCGVEEVRYQVPVYEAAGHEREEHSGGWSSSSDSDWDRSSSSTSSTSSFDNEERGVRQVGTEEKRDTSTTIEVEQRVAGPVRVAGGQPYMLEAELQIPRNAPPSYLGRQARHTYRLTVALDVAWSTNPSESIEVTVGTGEL